MNTVYPPSVHQFLLEGCLWHGGGHNNKKYKAFSMLAVNIGLKGQLHELGHGKLGVIE